MNKLIIIDGYSLFFRAYYATAYKGEDTILRTSNGTPINAIFTLGKMILPLLKSLNNEDAICVALDTGKPTFRHELNKDYKANRNDTPESLIIQMPILREFLDSINVKHIEIEGFEADDVAGTLATMGKNEGYNVELYTSDKDYLQLVDENITLCLIKKSMADILKITPDNFYDIYNFNPCQLIDYKGLRGDPSDNLKGIPGIGEKTAIDLLSKYKSIEGIYDNIDELKGKMKENLLNFKNEGCFCKEMATIIRNVDVKSDISSLNYRGYKQQDALSFIKKYELKTFSNDLTKLKAETNEIEKYEDNFSNNPAVPAYFSKSFGFAIDFEDTNYHTSSIRGFALCSKEKQIYITEKDAMNDPNFKSILESEVSKISCYDFKAIKYALANKGIKIVNPALDVSIARYILNSNITADLYSTFIYFDKPINVELGNESIAVQTAKFSNELSETIFDQLEKIDGLELYKTMEMPLANVLCDMEMEGFPIHEESLEKLRIQFEDKRVELEKRIYELAGHEFNISSPNQVSVVLFDELHLSNDKNPSTSVTYLKHLIDKHEIVSLILEYRKYAKLISTYINGLENQIYPDGKIHSIFNQTVTTTGRLSSAEPNMQNISVRDDESKLIRTAFYYEDPKYAILSYDYSQIELRLLASMSKCNKLVESFNAGEDIHSATAKHVFGKEEITDNDRRRAKAVNFGIIYGISDYGLKEQIGSSMGEAKDIIDRFYHIYPEIRTFSDNLIKELEDKNYVTTLFNRRRYIDEINDSNFNTREFAKRAAMNAPIQGTAADLIKMCMIKISDLLKNYDTKLISQIHDELIFKLNLDEALELCPKIKDIMEHILDLDVELKVDGGYAKTWYEVK